MQLSPSSEKVPGGFCDALQILRGAACRVVVAAAWLAGFGTAVPAQEDAGDAARMAREIIAKSCIGHDDPRAEKEYDELLKKGAAIFPGCIHILRHSKDLEEFFVVLILLEGMVKRNVDISPVLPAVRGLLQREDIGDRQNRAEIRRAIAIDTIETLGRIGTKDDVANLLDMLTDEDMTVRTVAAYTLADHGTPEMGPRIRAIVDKRKAGMEEEEALWDDSIKVAEEAIVSLKSKAYLEGKLAAARRGEGAVQEVLLDQLRYVSDVSLGDPKRYYDALMARLEACADEKAVPVLERLLNRIPERPGKPFEELRLRAAELWYRLKTRGLRPEQKVRYALYGFAADPPVTIPVEVSEQETKKLGGIARAELYGLLRAELKGQVLLRANHLISLVKHGPPSLAPRETEIEEFLSKSGTFGCMVIAGFLVERGNEEEAVEALLTLVRSDNPDVKCFAALRLWVDSKADVIIPVLLSEVRKDKAIPGPRSSGDEYVGCQLMWALANLPKDKRTIAFFKEYIREMWQEEGIWEVHFTEARGHALSHCLRAARTALKNWGVEP